MQKVDNFGLSTETKGGGISIAGSGGSKESSKKNERERLTDVGNFLLKNNALYTQELPVVGKYLLIRSNAMLGNMWNFGIADDDPMRNVVWWIGCESEDIRVFTYGDRRNFRKQGTIPDSGAPKSTWYPSDYGAYSNILSSVAASVGGEEKPSFKNSKVSSLIRYCFNDGVLRGRGFEGVWDILMHVHYVEAQNNEAPLVCGSPIWVSLN